MTNTFILDKRNCFFCDVNRRLIILFLILLFISTECTAGHSCVMYSASELKNKSVPYQEEIKKYSNKYNVDRSLVIAIIAAESCFKKNARSHKGAVGLMQLMSATAKRWGIINRLNANQNIQGGAHYISYLLRRFKGNLKLAVAGYHAGEGNVDKYNGIPPFKSTRRYVKDVLLAYSTLTADKKGAVNKADFEKLNLKENVSKLNTIDKKSIVTVGSVVVKRVASRPRPQLGTRFNTFGTRFNAMGTRF